MSLFCASFVIGHCAVNICEWNWSCSVCSQNSSGLTCKVLFIHFSIRNSITVWHVLSITAYCVRLYRAVWKLSRIVVLCKLFGIILIVHSTNGTIYTIFSYKLFIHFLSSSLFWFVYLYSFCLQSCVILAVLITLLFSLPGGLNVLSPPPWH